MGFHPFASASGGHHNFAVQLESNFGDTCANSLSRKVSAGWLPPDAHRMGADPISIPLLAEKSRRTLGASGTTEGRSCRLRSLVQRGLTACGRVY